MNKVTGSLVEKHNKYYAVYRIDGKQKWKCLGIPTTPGHKREAEKALKEILLICEVGNVEKYDITFIDFLDEWLEKSINFVKPSSWESYEKIVNGKLKPYFSPMSLKLRDVKVSHLNEYYCYLKYNGKSDGSGGLCKKTIKNIKSALSAAFDYAHENSYLDSNIVENSRLPIFEEVENEFEPVIYEKEQIKQLLDYAEETNSKVCTFLYLEMFTGARKGELLALTWDNVDLENGSVRICQNRTGTKKKTLEKITTPKTKNGTRTILLPPKVIEVLKKEKESQNNNRKLFGDMYWEYKEDFVIRHEYGRVIHPNTINNYIRNMTDKLGFPPCRVHDYRHAVASILFDVGVPLKDITIQLGHGQTSTTEKIYVKRKNVSNIANTIALNNAFGF